MFSLNSSETFQNKISFETKSHYVALAGLELEAPLVLGVQWSEEATGLELLEICLPLAPERLD